MLALSRATDEIARGSYDVDLPEVKGGGEIGHLAERFREMASRLSDAERQERNFLMSVSHELRTPLTAIRGHVDALREGVAEDPEARAASLDVIAREGVRLERLVGDVLDLAKLEAHRFTRPHGRGRHGTALRSGLRQPSARKRAAAASTYDKRFDAKPTIVSESSGKIASTGHSGSQAPQSMHSSGSITSIRAASWMQSTGQTSTHERSLMSMHGSAIT